jgi:CyaY protein
MSESEFLLLAEGVLRKIQTSLEQVADETDIDLECARSGNVLQVEFPDNDAKIIINTQAPMQEIWVAAKAGGYHYRHNEGLWLNTRDGSELFASLSALATLYAGEAIQL